MRVEIDRQLQIAAEKAIAHSLEHEPLRWKRGLHDDVLTRDDGVVLSKPYRLFEIISEKQRFVVIKHTMMHKAYCAFMQPLWRAEQIHKEATLKKLATSLTAKRTE